MNAPLFAPQPASLRPLRPHQERGLSLLRAAIAIGKRRPLLQMPTGAGKTLTAAHIVSGALAKGKRVAFVVPALSLIDQTVSAFEAEGIQALGVVQGIHPRTDSSRPVQICSIQTIARRIRPDVDIVIVDEAHLLHREIFRWMRDRPEVLFIGLSATPWARGLGKYFDHLIVAATTADLIRDGFLSRFQVFAPCEPDLADVRTVAGDFHEGELADACDAPKLIADIVTTWFDRARGLPTFVFAVNRRHAQHIAERFLEAGAACEYMDAATAREDREAIFERFRAGSTEIIVNVGVLTVGVDLDVRAIIDARPTKSEMRFVQTIGRGLRMAPGKDRLIILDHAGNTLRLGTVDTINHDSLDDGTSPKARAGQKPRPALPRKCEECAAVLARSSLRCPECGTPLETLTPLIEEDGELVELGSGVKATAPTIHDKAEFYAELMHHSIVKGYASGWAAHKFRQRFGTWPNDPHIRTARPRPTSLKTRNWILSRAIAYANATGRRAHG